MLEEESHKHSFYFFLSFLFFLIIFPSNVFSIYDQVIYDGWVLSGSYLNLSNEQYRVIYVKNTNSTVVYFPGGISAVISPTNKSCSKEWLYSVCQTNQKFERAGYDVLPTVNDPNINVSLYLQINSSNVGYHTLKNYKNINCLIINEKEIRHEVRNRSSKVEILMKNLAKSQNIMNLVVTKGIKGSVLFNKKQNKFYYCDSFSKSAIDKIGAGDTMLSLISLCLKNKIN
ncbi:hypothetical protein HN451_09770, partial [archaeon]|nr:hypothetical protein [archaeon]